MLLLFVFLTIKALGGYIYNQIAALFRLCTNSLAMDFDVNAVNGLLSLFGLVLIQLLKIVGPLFAVALVIGVGASYAQVGSLFTVEPLKPQLSKLNPINGIKEFFSLRGLTELIKAILK